MGADDGRYTLASDLSKQKHWPENVQLYGCTRSQESTVYNSEPSHLQPQRGRKG